MPEWVNGEPRVSVIRHKWGTILSVLIAHEGPEKSNTFCPRPDDDD